MIFYCNHIAWQTSHSGFSVKVMDLELSVVFNYVILALCLVFRKDGFADFEGGFVVKGEHLSRSDVNHGGTRCKVYFRVTVYLSQDYHCRVVSYCVSP